LYLQNYLGTCHSFIFYLNFNHDWTHAEPMMYGLKGCCRVVRVHEQPWADVRRRGERHRFWKVIKSRHLTIKIPIIYFSLCSTHVLFGKRSHVCFLLFFFLIFVWWLRCAMNRSLMRRGEHGSGHKYQNKETRKLVNYRALELPYHFAPDMKKKICCTRVSCFVLLYLSFLPVSR
jgi:hypothetical protein